MSGATLPNRGEQSVAALPARNCKFRPFSRALKPSPMRGRGTALAVDEVPTRAPDFVVSLSIAFESHLTAKLSLALRAARVEAQCPSESAVRAVNGAEG